MTGLGPLDGWVECPVCDTAPEGRYEDELSDGDGWAHGVEHAHFVDRWLVRVEDADAAGGLR